MEERLAERYVRLGLQVGRYVDGIVDVYYGPAAAAAAVDAAPPVEPAALVADAVRLLDDLEDGWLRDQVAGLRAYAGTLAGEPLSYADEAERCYGVRPAFTDESVFGAAHARLEELLPGDGPIGDRYRSWRSSQLVPAERVEPAVAAAVELGRAWTREVVELPYGEGVAVESVRGEPWLAFCDYLGGLRSRISVNLDLPLSAVELLRLALHETYPGHHAERALKEHHLVRGRGLLEESIVLVPTPQSLVSEGIAELAPWLVLESDAGPALAALTRDAGVELDLAHALAVERALEPCRRAEVNAALMLHDGGASPAETQAYLERWALVTPELAEHLVRFMVEPTSRTYLMTYSAGRELCGAYVAGDPARLARLLTEQVRVRDLVEARDARTPEGSCR